MSILSDLRKRVQSVQDGMQSGEIVRLSLLPRRDDILELQRIQLLQGLTSSGDEIRPYYSEDLKPGGYFYSVESAKRYADWKQTLSYPYSVERANADAPNLYINGKFHSELDVEFGSEAVSVVGGTGYAQEIIAKYGLRTFGLMGENWNVIFTERGAYDDMMREIESILYV